MNALNALISGYWDPTELATNAIVFLNIVGALVLGLIVGYERSYRGRAAGMRTYGLVCMASCALTVISGYPGLWFGGHTTLTNIDPGRTIQGIVTGIGFLGAGVIMRDGLNISGLTTAASIWSVSAIGVLVGVGFYGAAILLALLSTLFMVWGAKIEFMLPSRHAISMNLHFAKDFVPAEEAIRKLVCDHGFDIANGSFIISERNGQHEWRFVCVSMGREKAATLMSFSRSLSQTEGIESFTVSHARN
jgi:putative Mg2+ transporter-C (MgtC) family protein